MNSFNDISKCEAEMQADNHSVRNCLDIVKNLPESKDRKLLFYFCGTIKELKNKLKI